MYRTVENTVKDVLKGKRGQGNFQSVEEAVMGVLKTKFPDIGDKTYVEKDGRDQIAAGTYKTKHFEMEPRAQILYAQKLPKEVNPNLAEKSLIDHDKLFGIYKTAKVKQRAVEQDVKEAEKLVQNIKGYAKDMKLEKEHGYIDDILSKIKNLVDEGSNVLPDMTRFDIEKTKRFASKPYEPTAEPPDRDIDNDSMKVSRGLLMQRKIKIIDED